MTVVTRFPPSPTGFMHIGTARTALFNWLYAKHTGGKMMFRIEDTDRERHSEEAVEALIRGMKWLGLDWEGEIVSQYARRDRHREVAETLLENGKAYRCYCTPQELEDMRETAMQSGSNQFYDRRWRDRDPSEAPQGIDPVIRIKAPLDGESMIDDKVQGQVRVGTDQLDDFIILRSDGTPTYMLAVVVDDHDMGVTHVIRGDDHLSNTFRQNTVIDAMGWPQPVYAHIPLILSEDGSKMSKRKGAVSVEEYDEMGYLPEAMCNYILKLGWGHGDDEVISRDSAIEWFDFDGIVKSPARWDYAKLNFINAHYIKEADNDRLLDLVIRHYERQHTALSNGDKERIAGIMEDLKIRHKTVKQLAEEAGIMIGDKPPLPDEKAKDVIADGQDALKALHRGLKDMTSFSPEAVDALTREIATRDFSGKLGKVMMPFRAALTGRMVSPSIPIVACAFGMERVLQNLEAAIAAD